MYMDNEIQHHGILGMKWGVRRYQNYDGTYTQAGMKRYNKSLEEYEQKRSTEKQTKADYKAGRATKSDVERAKSDRKKQERQLKSDYKQLSTDKKADKGEALWNRGKRITVNSNKQYIRAAVASGTAMAAGWLNANGQTKLATKVGVAAAGMGVATAVLKLKDMHDDNLLRAYYSQRKKKNK